MIFHRIKWKSALGAVKPKSDPFVTIRKIHRISLLLNDILKGAEEFANVFSLAGELHTQG
jgi:hypothetical protein